MKLGSIAVSIKGDKRYTDRMEVVWNEDETVSIVVTESHAQGGMDGPGGTTAPIESLRLTTRQNPSARDVMKFIDQAWNSGRFNFKDYGKRKDFEWKGGFKGLSLKAINLALDGDDNG